jgi:hypothetical protein
MQDNMVRVACQQGITESKGITMIDPLYKTSNPITIEKTTAETPFVVDFAPYINLNSLNINLDTKLLVRYCGGKSYSSNDVACEAIGSNEIILKTDYAIEI